MRRGRRHRIPPEELQTILDQHKQEIWDESTGKVVTKAHKIWETLSAEVLEKTGFVKEAKSIYTHVTCRKVFAEQRSTENITPVS